MIMWSPLVAAGWMFTLAWWRVFRKMKKSHAKGES